VGTTRFQPTKKMRIETAVYTMHKRWVALKMSFKHRQETREYTNTKYFVLLAPEYQKNKIVCPYGNICQ